LSTPTLEHQRIILNIARKMADCFETRNSICEPFNKSIEVFVLSEEGYWNYD
jgi:hypothetical protein